MRKQTAYDIEYAGRLEIAKDDGAHFSARYDKDVRFVLERTNHRVHLPWKGVDGRAKTSHCDP